MYLTARTEEKRLEILHRLVDEYPLGALVRHAAAGLDADHLPFELMPPTPQAPLGVLRAHVARANPVWKEDGTAAMVVFRGPSAYVSPLCHRQQDPNRNVPTWDYEVVHAHGTLRTVDDPGWVRALLERMTARREAGQARPWTLHDAPPAAIDRMLKAVVGIEIVIERLDGKRKIS
ncbi:FMN-binding negative transcriptional regulator [Massilia horti]|uniref:FMN-binding negative transcriptional regulator n=1 Tax=Massilia horti TaxID=2562153 RepID=A0A4Y9T1M7_9BURK|nr:FMN-binding negative transcriptional regulator [Massilia horti]TFW30813.1 FMN-binding negative transcriptional regulator [Massilia horti]